MVTYGVAVLAVAVSLLIRAYVLHPVMGVKGLYVTFCPAVMIAAYFGGFRPGMLATVLGAMSADYFFVEPLYDLWIHTPEDLIAIGFFVLIGTFLSGVCEALHRSRRRVAASERRYAVTLSSIGDAVIVTDKQARVTFLNPVAEKLTGWSPVDARGKPLAEVFRIVNEQSRQPVEDPAVKVLRLGTVVGLANHTVLLARDGREVPIDDSGAPIIGESGGIAGVVLVFRDISERRESDKRFRTFVDHATDAFFLQDENYVILDVNRQACESLGYARDELLGSTPIDFDPDVTPALLDEINRKLDDGKLMAFESRHRRKNGTVFPVEIRGQAFWEGGRRFAVALARDITERKRAEEAIRESEQRWRNLTEALPQFVWTASADGTTDYFSTQIVNYTGRSEIELLARGWMDVLHPDDAERTRTRWLESVANQRNHEVEHRIRSSDGAYRWFTTRGVPIRDTAGHIVKWFGTCTDITEHKRSEQALRESEQRWRSLTEALPQLVWTATPDGACDYFSMQWTQHTGVPEDRLLGWQWMETLHPDDREPTKQLWTNSVAGRGPYDVEYRVRRTDGEYRWFKTRGVPIRDSEGNVFKWFGTCTDITDLRRTEEALRESEERFRGTFENAGVGIAHTQSTGRLLRVNEKFCAIVGYPREELLKKTFQDITYPDDLTISLGSLGTLMRGESAVVGHEKRYVRKDGSPVWVELFTTLQRDAAGQPAYAIAVVQDISERRRLDAEVRRAKEMAESANRAKDEFLANVSHEIRTPMNAILGMTELVLGTPLSDDQRQSLRTVKAAADNLLSILNDLLDFSKIEAGKMELDPADFGLRAALGDTLRTLAMRAHNAGLELVSHVGPDVPDALVGDPGRLRQVLLNLIGNAIKFTKEGEVVVRAEVAGDSTSDRVCVRFSVSDTGIGIPSEKQEKIFRAFEQEDTSTTRKYGGTGLGLTIAARLVALMGGTIAVDSEPGRGSTFAFTAQFGRQSHPPEPNSARPPTQLHNLPVLIIDDNATNCHILKEWLRNWQMEPAAVGDGVAAMDTLWDAATWGRPYQLVLLDARMPDTDGLVLAAKIRKRPELSATRIILLTSGDMPSNLARLRELRIDAHLLKPAQQDELLETIYQVMNGVRGNAPSAPPSAAAEDLTPEAIRAVVPLNILVAEDNDFNSQLLEQLLVRRGHHVQLANDGRKALSLAEDSAFDLLLLDVHMPELDGFQVIQAIRERERSAGGHLPVVALTARSRKEDRERCLAAGMDDFLAKPIQAPDLWSAIDRVVAARPPASRTGPGLLDPRVLLAACGGDAVILTHICQAFRTRLPAHLAAIQDALRDRDAPRLREAAHKVCGMVAAFSTLAGGVASDIEDHAAHGQLEDAQPLVGRLEEMAKELMLVVDGLSIENLRLDSIG
jgi:two-component system, sensor histidine kinase and response regulator